MDQDLSLMKQLLTLNEAIEDLKTKRLYHLSKDSLRASSQDMHASDWSVSETDMFGTDDESDKKHPIVVKESIQMSSISLPVPLTQESRFDSRLGLSFQRRSDIAILMNTTCPQVKHAPQSSVDSGYEEDVNFNKYYQGPLEVTF